MIEKETGVLFVCMGNVCRSPAGEGILKHLIKADNSLKVFVESCGIGNWHIGQPPDSRIKEASKSRGVVLIGRAKPFQDEYLVKFDFILAADKEILKFLYQVAKTPDQKAKIFLMTEFSSIYKGQEIPDPYSYAEGAFELVLDMLEDSCLGLLQHIRNLSKT